MKTDEKSTLKSEDTLRISCFLEVLVIARIGHLLRVLELLVEDHCRRSAEADAHPGGFVDFVLSKAFVLCVLQVHF